MQSAALLEGENALWKGATAGEKREGGARRREGEREEKERLAATDRTDMKEALHRARDKTTTHKFTHRPEALAFKILLQKYSTEENK